MITYQYKLVREPPPRSDDFGAPRSFSYPAPDKFTTEEIAYYARFRKCWRGRRSGGGDGGEDSGGRPSRRKRMQWGVSVEGVPLCRGLNSSVLNPLGGN